MPGFVKSAEFGVKLDFYPRRPSEENTFEAERIVSSLGREQCARALSYDRGAIQASGNGSEMISYPPIPDGETP
jgi:hypothetical protein